MTTGTLRRELDDARAGWTERGEVVLDSGLTYGAGDPVLVRVRKRGHRYRTDDDAGAMARAGKPTGWLEAARRVAEDERDLNVSRVGVVFVPAVEGGLDVSELAVRVADASLAVYEELLELGLGSR